MKEVADHRLGWRGRGGATEEGVGGGFGGRWEWEEEDGARRRKINEIEGGEKGLHKRDTPYVYRQSLCQPTNHSAS